MTKLMLLQVCYIVCLLKYLSRDGSVTLTTCNCQKLQVVEVTTVITYYFLKLVATGFPSGQYPLKTRVEEIKYAVEKGATEIDIVIDRSLVLTGKWGTLYQEIQQMKEACGPTAHMKTILATGELGTLDNVSLGFLVCYLFVF